LENLARGADGPDIHFDKRGNPKIALIREGHLLDGKLSVWRISDESGLGISDLKEILVKLAPSHQKLYTIFSITAKVVRSIKVNGDISRALCVLDECDTDREGNCHAAHAHISLCRQKSNYFRENRLEFEQIRSDLFTEIMSSRPLWSGQARK
jgi:hypothetical protein